MKDYDPEVRRDGDEMNAKMKIGGGAVSNRALGVVILLVSPFVFAGSGMGYTDDLAKAERLNGSKTLEAVTGVFDTVKESLVTIGFVSRSEEPIAVGVTVSEDGLIVTKASEFSRSPRVRVYTADGKGYKPTVVDADEKHDLVLLRIAARGLKPIRWGTSDKVVLGNWIASAAAGGEGVRLGAVSANRRPIERSGGAMGVMLGEESTGGGVTIESVAPRGSAKDAGLEAGDVIELVNGEKVVGRAALIDTVKAKNPGDRVSLQVLRGGKRMEIEVTLWSRSALFNHWERDPMMGGQASKRVDDFPEVIQHDTPLGASSMGGVLLDLEGRVVGLNIARIDRVTTFALPAELVGKVVAKLVASAPALLEAAPEPGPVRVARGRNGHYRR